MRSLLLLFSLATVCRAWRVKDIPQPTNGAIDNWAVLVAGSSGWINYRHQADIAHAYKLLIENDFPPDHIITMMVDDIARNSNNPYPDCITNHPYGENLYPYVEIDYKGRDVNPRIFEKVLLGIPTHRGSGKTLDSGPNSHVFINFVSHGANGLIAFPYDKYTTSMRLMNVLNNMHSHRRYAKLTFYLETCLSGSMFANLLPDNINVYANTACAPHENSYATYYSHRMKTCLGDKYSVTWMELMDAYFENADGDRLALQDAFRAVREIVTTSNVTEYGDFRMGNLEWVNDFFHYRGHLQRARRLASSRVASKVVRDVESNEDDHELNCFDVTLDILERRAMAMTNETEQAIALSELEEELEGRERAAERFARLASEVQSGGRRSARSFDEEAIPLEETIDLGQIAIYDHECLSRAIDAFHLYCHVIDEHHLTSVAVIAHLCEAGYTDFNIFEGIMLMPQELCSKKAVESESHYSDFAHNSNFDSSNTLYR